MSIFRKIFGSRKADRTEGEDLAEQAELAEHFRDVLSVARKFDFAVIITVEVNNLRQGVICRGRDDEVTSWLFNYAAGRYLSLSAKAQEWANLNGLPAGRWKPRKEGGGARIDPDGP